MGGPGADVIYGGTDSSPSVVSGGGGADALHGGAGPDVLTGGPGRDIFIGRDANDIINAKDGEVDRIACGRGVDKVTGDRRDQIKACEKLTGVQRLKPGQNYGPPPPGPQRPSSHPPDDGGP